MNPSCRHPHRYLPACVGRRLTALVLALALLCGPHLPDARALSIGEEREIGEQLLYQIRNAFQVVDDPEVVQYVNDLGRLVLEPLGPQNFTFYFYVIKDKEFNAFAAPSGLIFMHSGLVASMRTENELLAVMAHEIGHVTSRHISSRLEKSTKVSIASMALALGSLAIGNPALAQGLLAGSLATGQALQLSFSRQDEEEADRLAFGWMKALGRDPSAMADMLRVMRRISRYRMGQVPQYLLTHPDSEARLLYVESLLDSLPKSPPGVGQGDDFAFLRFKYRVLSQTADPRDLREQLASLAAGPDQGLQTAMADYGLAMLALQERNWREAKSRLERVRQKMPDKKVLLVDLATVDLESGDVLRALEGLKVAARQNPGSMAATWHLARAWRRAGEGKQAEPLYQDILARQPDLAPVYYELSELQSSRKQLAASTLNLGKYNLYSGKPKVARQHFEKVSSLPGVTMAEREEATSLLARLTELEKK
ncbi:MAG: hypothetical protein BWK76_24580 [Desulfobulbaceae bacterium A2]|nr:MAG: hypothetical protein BWK76_24580 [Desulfobulbaceae bacterium A2]